MSEPSTRRGSAVAGGVQALAVVAALALVATCAVSGGAWAWATAHPCWRFSNAAWCGHFCDEDPCSCPDRRLGPSAYGSGPGCVP